MTTGGRHCRKKKKAGVNNKVNIPQFGGKDAPILMTWPVPSRAGPGLLLTTEITSDLGLIMEKIRNLYCRT